MSDTRADQVKNTWFRMLDENVVGARPENGSMVGKSACTPLGLLCMIADEIGPWPFDTPIEQMEFPPYVVAQGVGLRCMSTDRGEAVGYDIDWINSMTDRGVDDRIVGLVVRDVLRQREETHGYKAGSEKEIA